MERFRLDIEEVGIINAHLKNKHNKDYTFFNVLTSKFLLEDFCFKNSIKSFTELEKIVSGDASFKLDKLFRFYRPRQTELFRNPDAWKYLYEKGLNDIGLQSKPIQILQIGFSNAFELISLGVLLKKTGLESDATITVLDDDERLLDNYSDFDMTHKEKESSILNYKELGFSDDLEAMLTKDESDQNSVLSNLRFEFKKKTIGLGTEIGVFDLVIARDLLIYFNKVYHERLLRWFIYHMKVGSYLVLGTKDSIDWTTSRSKLKEIDKEGRIYKKIKV